MLLTQHITSCTRSTVSSKTCIDLIFSNIRYVRSSGTINLHLSDHVPIFLTKKKLRNRSHPVKLNTRGSSFDNGLIEEELGKVDWSFIYCESDPTKLWEKNVHLYNGDCK